MQFVQIDTAEDIYGVLSTDSQFSALVGSLEFEDGAQPALLVALASEPLTGLDGASGLLVVIEKDPVFTSKRLLTPEVVIDRMFTLRLIQFAGTPRNLRAAIERLLAIFPGSSAIPLATPNELTGDGQAVVKLPSNPVAHL